jgi:DNA polymerase (family X)
MDNNALSDNFSLLSKLMDIHGDDSFKSKSYSSAAFTLDKLPMQVASLPADKLFSIKGIGPNIGKKIIEQVETGRLQQLDEYIVKTPPGILQMLKIKGLGPKKIATIWKELGVENIGELLYACEENRLLLYKGFGAKTQQTIKENIEFYLNSQGSYLFSQVEEYANEFLRLLQDQFPTNVFLPAGNFNRHDLVIHKLTWISNATAAEIQSHFEEKEYEVEVDGNIVLARGAENVKHEFHLTTTPLLYTRLFENNCSAEFMQEWENKYKWNSELNYSSEEEIFKSNNVPYLPPYLRELPEFIGKQAPTVVEPTDIRGIIHMHSDWSDGVNTIEEMANAAIEQGLEYIVMSDHSQAAYYAKGLYPERIRAQHQLIDELNKKLSPFKIFKSIESDILNDGSLDYPTDILASFDLVITSVHSNIRMAEDKAMMRLMNAIANPFTTILGHMTGRLLLARNGYPVDHKAIIDTCAKYNVVIEINANPRRLDMDYHFIPYALEKGVLLSINPDAHSIDGYEDVRYGVLAAQKGGLTKAHNLSSFTLKEFETFLAKYKEKTLAG